MEKTWKVSVYDMVSKFEGGRTADSGTWQQARSPGAPRRKGDSLPARVDGGSSAAPGDSQPAVSSHHRWGGLQSFRKHLPSTRLIQRGSPPALAEEPAERGKRETNEEKLFKIAKELLETETAYVSRLHLLDQVFYAELLNEARTAGSFPEDVVKQIFSNISSIYQFHSLFLLPELQRRMDEWGKVYTLYLDDHIEMLTSIISGQRCKNPRIGDVLQKVAPFLKMYGQYVMSFDKAMHLISTWMEKSTRFEEIILDIQKREISGNLTLQHHMLEPVQRVPRYEMLLKDYLKKLPEGSPDRADAEKSLEIIFEAAKHSNSAIADMERLEKLWEVYEMLGMDEEMVDPSNKLLQEGPVQKISFRRNTLKDSHLFLFNNMLLYCVPRFSLGDRRYIIRARVDMDCMQVKELNDVEFPHSFLVSGKLRTLEFQARSQEDMEAWIKACQQAIDQNEKKTESFKHAINSLSQDLQELTVERQELGKRAPQWIRDNLVSMCMRCSEPFNAIIRRRHHCRACGYVVCWKCSDYKAALLYDANRMNRVCRDCYSALEGQADSREREDKKRGILEKEAAEVSERSLMCSFLTIMDRQGKGGTRGWFVIPRDEPLILYMYAAPQDVKAQTTIPLLGYQVKEQLPGSNKCTFQLSQSKQVFTFVAESEEQRDRWVEIINQVASGEEPWHEDD